MTNREKYFIKISDALVEVTKEVYEAYYSVERHMRTLDEKDARNGTVLYRNLDTKKTLGVEMLRDLTAESVEDEALLRILSERLHKCLSHLPESDQQLIRAIYFEDLSEREYARQVGLSQKGVNKRKHKILKKLRKMVK